MKRTAFISNICAVTAGLIMFSACSGGNSWKINGKIDGADKKELILEASANGRWYPIDTIITSSSGSFSATHAAVGYPDIFRLRLDGKSVYFPIDSIETVTINSNADSFDTGYTISGSAEAEMMMEVDRKLAEAAAKNGAASLAADSILKRELGSMLLADPSGIVAYYIISKSVGGVPLFNPAVKSDNRVIGAVANAYSQYRPNDPRTKYLKSLYLNNRMANNPASGTTLVAEEVPIFEIALYDNTGTSRSLKETASKNRVVLLNFTAYGAEQSPAFNVELNKIYERHHANGFEIYQVAIDENEYLWRQTAKNLPWVTVYQSGTDDINHLLNYNVAKVPTSYIIKNGELVDRIDNFNELASKVGSYM